MSPRAPRARDFDTEAAFQREIIRIAKRAGWRVNHCYRAKLADGTWRTTTTWVGWPDLELVKPGRHGWLEVKGVGGVADPEQLETIALLQTIPGAFAFIVWPADYDAVVELLTAA